VLIGDERLRAAGWEFSPSASLGNSNQNFRISCPLRSFVVVEERETIRSEANER
jgi:hypothetical protein